MVDAMDNTRTAVRANAGLFVVLAAVVAISSGAEVWEQLPHYREIILQPQFLREASELPIRVNPYRMADLDIYSLP